MNVNAEKSTTCNAAVWADLPSCGLGNKLLIWGKALAFARLHALPLTVTGWNNRNGLRTWLKGGGWRRYNQDFNSPSWMSQRKWQTRMRQSHIVDEPQAGQLALEANNIYRFHKMTHWSDYFGEIKPIRETVIKELPKLLSDHCRSKVEALKPIDMAIHIRMGDFRPLKPGEKFAEVGHVRTPLEYFTQIIENVRTLLNKPVHVTVFSDGKDSDLQSILSLPNLERAEPAAAIVDIYRMAKSKLLVCAAGSTFSYWSVFLAEQPAIIHRDHIHQPIRPSAMGNTIFEGAVPEELEQWPALLCSNLREMDW